MHNSSVGLLRNILSRIANHRKPECNHVYKSCEFISRIINENPNSNLDYGKRIAVTRVFILYMLSGSRGAKRVITSFGISWRGIHEVLCPSKSVPKLTYASCVLSICSVRILSSVTKETSRTNEMLDVECRFSSNRFPISLPVREVSRRWSGLS